MTSEVGKIPEKSHACIIIYAIHLRNASTCTC